MTCFQLLLAYGQISTPMVLQVGNLAIFVDRGNFTNLANGKVMFQNVPAFWRWSLATDGTVLYGQKIGTNEGFTCYKDGTVRKSVVRIANTLGVAFTPKGVYAMDAKSPWYELVLYQNGSPINRRAAQSPLSRGPYPYFQNKAGFLEALDGKQLPYKSRPSASMKNWILGASGTAIGFDYQWLSVGTKKAGIPVKGSILNGSMWGTEKCIWYATPSGVGCFDGTDHREQIVIAAKHEPKYLVEGDSYYVICLENTETRVYRFGFDGRKVRVVVTISKFIPRSRLDVAISKGALYLLDDIGVVRKLKIV